MDTKDGVTHVKITESFGNGPIEIGSPLDMMDSMMQDMMSPDMPPPPLSEGELNLGLPPLHELVPTISRPRMRGHHGGPGP